MVSVLSVYTSKLVYNKENGIVEYQYEDYNNKLKNRKYDKNEKKSCWFHVR
jgi:hypothetical protein